MATASNISGTQSATQSSATQSSIDRANSYQPQQVDPDTGIIIGSSEISQVFNWSQISDFGNNSYIPNDLKSINEQTGFSIETPSGYPTNLIPNPPQTDQIGIFTNNSEDIVINQPEVKSDLNTPENNNQPPTNLPRINSFFEPKIVPENISINLSNLNKGDQEQIRENLGFAPFIWYNNIQIDYKDIESFVLKYENNIPVIKIFFRDSFGIMKQVGFPGDDTLITVFINSRSKNLRSIKMDFKILTFNDFGNGSFSISGIVNIPRLYTKKFESFNRKTSHQTLREVAKNLDCGFCSNLGDTDDLMTWINPGNSSLEFIGNVLTNAYVSDDSFLFYYIDFYYNICYVDINKELTRDVNEDVMVNSMGFSMVKSEREGSEETIIPLILSNDNSFEASNGFISEYTILNRSTKISLLNSYKTLSKTWNVSEKEFLLFDIETITPDGEKEIILKGRTDDSTFFRENVEAIWLGKLETDNSHKNFAYSKVQNNKNLDEITKIGATLTLSTPNLNLYLFQKVKVLFSAKKLTPTHEEQFFKRLSGDWLIIGMEIKFDGKKVYQILNVIKTTLSMTPEESQKSVAPKERSESEVAEKNTNESPDQETPPPSGPTQSGPTPPPVEWEILYPSYQGTENGNNIKAIIDTLKSKGMTNPFAIVGILTIIGKETNYVPKNESLNYSKERLPEVWGKFSKTGKAVPSGQGKNYYNELAVQYENNPEKLANFVYSNKYGNGPEDSGDGFRYRGRGYNQITFKGTYEKMGKKIGKDFVSDPDSINQIRLATESLYVFLRDRCLERSAKIGGGIDSANSVDEAILKFAWANAGWNKSKNQVLNFDYKNAKKYESKFEISNKGVTT